jgi:hypothetical protein
MRRLKVLLALCLPIIVVPVSGLPPAMAASASQAQFVTGSAWLTSVACDPSGALCMTAGVTTGQNSATPGKPMVSLFTADGVGALLHTRGFYVHGLSCPDRNTCYAVGETNDYSLSGPYTPGFLTLQVSKDVVKGISYKDGAPTTGAFTSFGIQGTASDIYCESSTACVALLDNLSTSQYEIANFNPVTASDNFPLTPLTSFATLDHVACISSSECLVAGADPSNSNGSLIGIYDPSTNVLVKTRAVSRTITALACQSATVCYALESNSANTDYVQSVKTKDASTGTSYPLAYGSTSAGGGYRGLACAALSPCLAVGQINPTPGSPTASTQPLTDEIVNGVPTAAVIGTSLQGSDSFIAAACPLANECEAVGTTAPEGGPGVQSSGMAAILTISGQEKPLASVNSPDGTTCMPNGAPDLGIGSNFQAASEQSTSTVYGISATIGGASDCYDPGGVLYPSSWVMLQNNHAFVQAGIAYHKGGKNDTPFIELSPDCVSSTTCYGYGWNGTNWTPPKSDGIDVGPGASSIEFPKWNLDSGTFTITDNGETGTTRWCSWVPSDARNHPELEGNTPGFLSQSYEYQIDMNGKCLWYFYLNTSAPPPEWANLSTETHSTYQHAPGTLQSPLVFSNAKIETTSWIDFSPAKHVRGLTLVYFCNADAGQGKGSGSTYTFSTWGTAHLDNHLEPASCSQ